MLPKTLKSLLIYSKYTLIKFLHNSLMYKFYRDYSSVFALKSLSINFKI
jgi:hypothetical protein